MSPASSRRAKRPAAPDSSQVHLGWLNLVEVSGPFLSLPVLRTTWPALDALDKGARERLRVAHAQWQADPARGQRDWIAHVAGELLGWGDALWMADDGADEGLDVLAMDVREHDTRIVPSFALVEPGEDPKPGTTALLGLTCEPGTGPTARIKGSAWAATPADRLAHLCRSHGVELGLATEGRWWALVWAPRGKATTTAVFDAVSWPEAAERDVVRAFVSLLCRRRFFAVPDDEKLPKLLRDSEDSQEDITEALGVQVRRAVELLVAAIGRADAREREAGEPGLAESSSLASPPARHASAGGSRASLADVDAHEVYRGAVAVMMRVVFLLFAEERGLLPADNELYASAYSAGRLAADLEQRAIEGSEDDLEHTSAGWHRLLALFNAVYHGVSHPRLSMHAHDGSIFDPDAYPWLPLSIDDRTVLHMLAAVQYVQVGTGKSRERRSVSFRSLDVEQIGYVYEGLLSFEGFRANGTVVGLVGKEGLEEEVPLADLEEHARAAGDVGALAGRLAEAYKDSRIGSAKKLEKALAPPDDAGRQEALRKLLAVSGGDRELAERLLPFFGILRSDLRGLPVVILPGALYVTESALRKNTGTHYTPSFLAKEVVKGALEPLVYEPGPLATAERDEWRLTSSAAILSLKVADIAMGSAAFLVAACRYLGDRLVEAWSLEGDERARVYLDEAPETPTEADVDPLVTEARRQVIEHCLYGVDINPMAVEMAKLSLWLVSMDPQRPFTFLDDRLAVGDSLLGVTSLEQLEVMHLDEARGRQIHERALLDFTTGVRELTRDIAADRAKLTDVDGSTMEGLAEKRALLAGADRKAERARLFADLATGAALANAGKGDARLRDGSIAAADHARRVTGGSEDAEDEAHAQAQHWLATDLPAGGFSRQPLHWPLVFPEVFDSTRPNGGGFDAIIGNPPFLGGPKLRPSLGASYRELLPRAIGDNVRGTNTDLVAFFVLRAHDLLNASGQTGLLATNSLAQGDTRTVSLDQVERRGVIIRAAIKSEKWPSRSAVLEYCAVWTSRAPLGDKVPRLADGVAVEAITSSLEPASRVIGQPGRLAANRSVAFLGHHVNGLGFAMTGEEADELCANDRRSGDVVHPYLVGQDINSRPDCSASRWIINFHDWNLATAESYRAAISRVRQLVKPERDKRNRESHRKYWWQYADYRRGLEDTIAGLERVIVITLVSKTAMPVIVPTGQVYSHALGVFGTEDTAMLALLSSAPHYWWARSRASSMKTDLRYTPSDVFETFPLPKLIQEMRELGDRLDTYRREVMLSRQAGLTKTYNLVFDPACQDDDIVELRRIHRDIDEATVRAYGWDDLLAPDSPYGGTDGGLDHGFHPVAKETRYTIGPQAKQEILDRLLELNHQRYAKEVEAGLHTKATTGSERNAGTDDESRLF